MKKIFRTFFIFFLLVAGCYLLILKILLRQILDVKSFSALTEFPKLYEIISAFVVSAVIILIGIKKDWSNKTFRLIVNRLLCYFLGLSLLPYGLTKIFQTQFVTFPSWLWHQPLEKLRGIDLAWAFLGYSPWFQILLGFLEIIPALLLLFRRTAFIGTILMLPMTLNVFLINYALDLFAGTKILASLFLAVNILLIFLEWNKIRSLAAIIIEKAKIFKYFGWELLLAVIVIIICGYPDMKLIWEYRNDRNFLTGDWLHKKPNEWILTSEQLNDSTLSNHRLLKSYFGPHNHYWEVDETNFSEYMTSRYQLDEKHQTITLSGNNTKSTFISYRLINDSTLQIIRPADDEKESRLTQLFHRRIINVEKQE